MSREATYPVAPVTRTFLASTPSSYPGLSFFSPAGRRDWPERPPTRTGWPGAGADLDRLRRDALRPTLNGIGRPSEQRRLFTALLVLLVLLMACAVLTAGVPVGR